MWPETDGISLRSGPCVHTPRARLRTKGLGGRGGGGGVPTYVTVSLSEYEHCMTAAGARFPSSDAGTLKACVRSPSPQNCWRRPALACVTFRLPECRLDRLTAGTVPGVRCCRGTFTRLHKVALAHDKDLIHWRASTGERRRHGQSRRRRMRAGSRRERQPAGKSGSASDANMCLGIWAGRSPSAQRPKCAAIPRGSASQGQEALVWTSVITADSSQVTKRMKQTRCRG